MSPEKKEKRASNLRWLLVALNTIGLGVLSYIGANVVPFISDWNAKRTEDKNYQQVMSAKVDTLQLLWTDYLEKDKAKTIAYEKQFRADKEDIQSVKDDQKAMFQTQLSMLGMINSIQNRIK